MGDEGYHVVMLGRTQATLDDTLAAIEADGGSGLAIKMDSIGASAGFEQATCDIELMEKEIVAGFDAACAAGELKFVCQNQGPNMPPPTVSALQTDSCQRRGARGQRHRPASFLTPRCRGPTCGTWSCPSSSTCGR